MRAVISFLLVQRGPVPSCYEDADEEEEEEDMDEDDVDSLRDVEMASEGELEDDDMPLPEIDRQHLLDEFDQGMRNAYFPRDVAFKETIDGHGVRVTARGQEYVYENWNGNESKTKIKGRFHDRETCVGCAMREKQERKRRDAGC